MSSITRRSVGTTPTSILKRPRTFKEKFEKVVKTPKVQFNLPHSEKVRSILHDYTTKVNQRDYDNLIVTIRDANLSDREVSGLLKEASDCVALLNRDLKLFVEVILNIKWTGRCESVVQQYQSFLVNLLSAHVYHDKSVIDMLVSNFIPAPDAPEWPEGVPQEKECKASANVHSVIVQLLKVVPMCKDLLLKSITNQYPYLKKPTHFHELYLYNLFLIMDYEPQMRLDILHLIFSRLIVLDVNAPREEIVSAEDNCDVDGIFAMDDDDFNVEEDDNPTRMKHGVAHTLDVCMDKVLNYLILECHDVETGQFDWEKTKSLYHELVAVFETVILPTFNIHHVQFVMFMLCSFKSTITEGFLNFLWKKVCSPHVPSVYRQTAVSYIASLIARATFVPVMMLKGTLQQMASWIHSYIAAQDSVESANCDLRVHAVFFAVCQALFYAVTFRHRELLDSKKNTIFLQTLNLPKIVMCRLNPLRFCQPAVLQNFAAVTRTYQLAYCYTIIEHNTRNVVPTIYHDDKGAEVVSNNMLSSFFPFDPYLLKRSGLKVKPHYREYQELTDDSTVKSAAGVEVDDFLGDERYSPTKSDRFSYGTSPGYKF